MNEEEEQGRVSSRGLDPAHGASGVGRPCAGAPSPHPDFLAVDSVSTRGCVCPSGRAGSVSQREGVVFSLLTFPPTRRMEGCGPGLAS